MSRLAARGRLWAPGWGEREFPWPGLAVRAVTVLAGLAVLTIPADSDPVWMVLTVLGVLVAVRSPGQGGAGLALGSGVGGWFAAYGAHGSPPVATTAGYALALYLIHTSTALAAAVPLGVPMRAPVLSRWLRRCLIELAVAAGLAAVSYGSYGFGRPGSSSILLLLGLAGVLVLVGVPVLLLHRSRG